MSETIQTEIAKQKKRGKSRVKVTAEVFTPMDLCRSMVSEIPLKTLKDPSSTFLDNSCGDGNFLVALFEVLSEHHHPDHVLDYMIYGVDLMPDNVMRAKERLGITDPKRPAWSHIVCADGINYDYSFTPEAGSQSSMVEEF